MQVTWAKLNSGVWGIRVIGAIPATGDYVEVTKRDGSVATVCIAQVLWTGADRRSQKPAALCRIFDASRVKAKPKGKVKREPGFAPCDDAPDTEPYSRPAQAPSFGSSFRDQFDDYTY